MNPQDFLRGVLAAALRRLGPSPSRTERTLPSRLKELTVSKLKAAAGRKSEGSIDLASGAPDFQTPETLKALAIEAITSNQNQYAHPMGDSALRSAIAGFTALQWQRTVNPDSQITVTSGTSAALAGLILSLIEPGDEVIVFEPFFESYLQAIKLAQGVPRLVSLSDQDWRIDKQALAQAFSNKTRAVILNTPHNPTGRAFDNDELLLILTLAEKYNAVLISDEIYSQLTFDGRKHLSPGAFADHASRVIVVDGLSKAYNATGWRVGYVIAPEPYSSAFRTVHSTLGLAAPTPFQIAARSVFQDSVIRNHPKETASFPYGEPYAPACPPVSTSPYSEGSSRYYQEGRDRLCKALEQAGFIVSIPDAGAFVLADGSKITPHLRPDWLEQKTGILAVSGDSFFDAGRNQSRYLRFCFARKLDTIDAACQALAKL